MKELHKILLLAGAIILLFAILGGSLTKSVFGALADRSLKTAGLDKANIDSTDAEIDEMYYKINQAMLQLEKLKNIFSDRKIDESPYQKVKKELISKTIYEPVREIVILLYRILFFCISCFTLAASGIFFIYNKFIILKKRVNYLESSILNL